MALVQYPTVSSTVHDEYSAESDCPNQSGETGQTRGVGVTG